MLKNIEKYVQPIRNFWVKLTARTKKMILFSLGGVIVLCVVLGLLLNRTTYAILYPDLDRDEAVEVMTELQKQGVDCREDNGTIYVPSEEENAVRMQLANEGYPKSAPNYDFFTSHVGVMTTDYEKKVIQQYQLNQRLEDVIKTLDPIDNAYVTISIPDSGDYAWDDKSTPSTASVAVKLKAGRALDSQQVNGIKQLVSKSVPNLTAANVSVIDNSSGEELYPSTGSEGDSGSLQMDMTEFKLKVEQQYETNLEKKIMDHLADFYGRDNLSISVKSQMDLDKKIQDIVTYQPTTSDGKGIVSESEESHEQTQTASGGGEAGAQTNADNTTTYPGVTVSGNTITTKDSQSYKYLVSHVEEQIESDAGALQNLTVSVIVHSDAMSENEVNQLKNAVAFASGVDPAKVDVMNKAFPSSAVPANTEPAGSLLPFDWGILAAAGGGFLLIVFLTVLFLARRRRKRVRELESKLKLMQESEASPEDQTKQEVEAIPEESIEEIRQSTGGKEEKIRKDLQDFSSQNPEIAAQLIRSWLRGEDDRG